MADLQMRVSVATRVVRTGLFLSALVGLIVVMVTFLPLVPWTASLLAGDFHPPSGDVLVVLAQSVELLPVGLVLDRGSYWLTEYAQTAYRQGRFRRIIITGGGNAGTPVAAVMAELLQFNGVPAEAIEVEVSSRNMRQQAEAVRSLLDQKKDSERSSCKRLPDVPRHPRIRKGGNTG